MFLKDLQIHFDARDNFSLILIVGVMLVLEGALHSKKMLNDLKDDLR